MAETRRFTMHPRLLFDVIQRQAGSLSKALLEAVMNAVDAGATKVEIEFKSPGSLRITDDGRGFRSRKEIEDWFEVFGTPHLDDEEKVFGAFRMGRGQGFAYGANEWRTGRFRMVVDVKNRGLDYELDELPDSAQGCEIAIDLYEELSAVGQRDMEMEFRSLVKWIKIPVVYNGEQISQDPDGCKKWDHVLPEAYVRLKDAGDMRVYNLGALVRSYPGHKFGCGGEVVSRRQLKVNFARNDVQSDCPIWRKIKPLVDSYAGKKIRKTALTEAARQWLIDQWSADELDADDAINLRIITDVTGRHWSLRQLRRSRYKKCTIAPQGDARGDWIMQRELGFVFADAMLDQFHVANLPALLKVLSRFDKLSLTPVKFDTLADQFEGNHELIPRAEWTVQERLVIDVLQSTVWWLCRSRSKRSRRIVVGLSDCDDGWTDGDSYVAIGREYICKTGTSLSAWVCYGLLLVHEHRHDGSDINGHVHDPEFYALYHEWTAGLALSNFVNRCVTKFPQTVLRYRRKLTRQQLCDQDRLDRQRKAEAAAAELRPAARVAPNRKRRIARAEDLSVWP